MTNPTEPRLVVIATKVHPDLAEAVKERAKQEDRTVSSLVRNALREHVLKAAA